MAVFLYVTAGGCSLRKVAGEAGKPGLLDQAASAMLGSGHGMTLPDYNKCKRRLYFGLRRRDIAFLKRLRGRRCLLITDQSPHPPGVSHQAQHHIGHLTFLWVDTDPAHPEDTWKILAHTASVFETESTAAKFVLQELETCVEQLIRISGILQSTGDLGRLLLRSASHCAVPRQRPRQFLAQISGTPTEPD